MEQDHPWKELVEKLFEDFLAFFFPDIHKDIDFSKGYAFLEQELQKFFKSHKLGNRLGDKLVKVYLGNGREKWLLIHIELQGYKQLNFPERMFIYNYRFFDKFRKEIISLALLTDANPNFRPGEYRRARWGFAVSFRYPVVKVLDYRERQAELEANKNPFAIIVRAFLKTLDTEGNTRERYTWKKRFLLELYKLGMKRETILAIYKFIDWMMTLPKGLNIKIHEEVAASKEAKKMSYLTTAERIGMEKGLEKGFKQGLFATHHAIAAIIDLKFGKTGRRLSERVYKIGNPKALQTLTTKLKRAQSVAEAETVIAQIAKSNGKQSH